MGLGESRTWLKLRTGSIQHGTSQLSKDLHGWSLYWRAIISLITCCLSAWKWSSAETSSTELTYDTDSKYHTLKWCKMFIPLSQLKFSKNCKSLCLFVTRMLTTSGGLFWFATNSCQYQKLQKLNLKLNLESRISKK